MKLLRSWLMPLVAMMALAAMLAYLLMWPVPIEPVAWSAPVDLGHTGAHSENQRLAKLHTWALKGDQEGPEHITSYQGTLYTALSNGDIVSFKPDGSSEVLANTGGRPLGMEPTPDGTLYIADAMKGLLSINLTGGTPHLRTLLDKIDHPLPDDRIRYADAVGIDVRGNVWLTDASRRFSAKDNGGTFEASVLDILEGSCTGRVIVMDPNTGRHRVALTGLCFPNGMAFTPDGRSMLLSETGRYRILKIDLANLSVARSAQGMTRVPSLQDALKQGAAKVLIDNLPGFPDNVTRGENGRFWTGLTKPRGKVVDFAADKPWLRELTLRLPRALWPVPKAYGHIFAFDENGQILDDLQDPSGAYPETTAATEVGGKLFVQSLNSRSVGWLPYSGPQR